MSKTIRIVSFSVELIIAFGLALLFPIVVDKVYGWFGGLFHGAFLIPNWIISWFANGHLLKAPLYSGAYNVCWWIGAGLGLISCLVYGLSLLMTVLSKEK